MKSSAYTFSFSCSILFLLVACSVKSQAQITPGISIQHTLLIAGGKEISQVYSAGFGIGLQGNIPLFKRKFSIQPEVSYNYFGNYYNASARDNLNIFNGGVKLAYNFTVNEKTILSPAFGIYYSWGEDHISPRSGYTGDAVKLFTFGGMAYSAGLQLAYGQLIVQGGYVFSKVKATIGSGLEEDLQNQFSQRSSIYTIVDVEDAKLSFNRFFLTVGYHIQFKK